MPPAPPTDLAPRRTLAVLFGLTVAGAALRFWHLGQPCLWGDEALVYWRTCGTFAQLLGVLHGDGFPPLHYELAWVIGHAVTRAFGRPPGPAALRAASAACGTLLVPAVYALARQLLPRRPSLWAAAVTAFNAFALFYSRDAKMYAEAWLAMTLSVAALLAWVRTGRTTAWLAWVAAGSAAAGLQTLTLISVLGLSPLLLLTQRRAHWRQLGPWLAGVALIGAGPVGYYARFNTWTGTVEQNGWRDSGLAWVGAYNFGRTGPQQARYLTTTFLTGWEWPRAAAFAHMPAGRGWLLCGAATLAVACVAAGGLPWPRRWRPVDPDGPEPPWRATLWLGAWVVLPLYGFYCRSNAGFARPGDALVTHPRWCGAAAALTVAAAVAALAGRPTRAAARRALPVLVALAAVVAACQPIGAVVPTGPSVWVPRYLGFVWPAVAVATGALLARLPTAPARWSAAAWVFAVNLGLWSFRLLGTTEPPVDRMAADVWAAQPVNGRPSGTLTWTDLGPTSGGNGGGHLFADPGRYYLQRLADRPMSPDAFHRSLSSFRLHRGDLADGLPGALTPGVRRVILWEQADTPADFSTDTDLGAALPHWHLAADQSYTVRDVWTGQDLSCYRRREYADRRP